MAKMGGKTVDTLSEEMHGVIARLVRRLRAEGAQHELSWSQLATMARLESGDPKTIAALAREEGVKPQSMGAIVASLERAGLVERDPHPSDGRQIMFSLTKEGRGIRNDGVRAKRKWLAAKITSELNAAEQRTLRTALGLIERLLSTE
jgi:DNA-binding MarR family transcriptional regulator